jgi:hypothetical protein
MSWYGNVSSRQRRTYTILIGIIALTVPCYCIGLSALALAPGTRASRSPTTPTLSLPPNTPVSAAVTLPPDATLRLMPTEGQPHTLMPTSSPTSTGTPTSSPTVSRPTESPIPLPSPTPEPTATTELTATPMRNAYTLLIAKRGEDRLFVVNESARAFPLEALRLGDGEGAINGREWGIATLEPGKCVTAWRKGGKPQPPNISCTQVGKRLTRSGDQRFWTSAFKVYYLGEQVGDCVDAQCTITIVER